MKYTNIKQCNGVFIANQLAKSKSKFWRWINSINFGEKMPVIKVNMNAKMGWWRIFLHEVGHYVHWLMTEIDFRKLDVQHKEEVAECYFLQCAEDYNERQKKN